MTIGPRASADMKKEKKGVGEVACCSLFCIELFFFFTPLFWLLPWFFCWSLCFVLFHSFLFSFFFSFFRRVALDDDDADLRTYKEMIFGGMYHFEQKSRRWRIFDGGLVLTTGGSLMEDWFCNKFVTTLRCCLTFSGSGCDVTK